MSKFILAKSLQVGDFITVWSVEREVTHVGFPDHLWMEVGVKDQATTYLINIKQQDFVLARPKPEQFVKGTVVVIKGQEQAPLVRGAGEWFPGARKDAEIAAAIREGKAHVVYTPPAK